MELSELKEAVDDIRPEEAEATQSLALVMVKVGQMAEGALKVESADEEVDDDHVTEAREDMLAGLLVAAAEYATEHDLDIEDAVASRLERMREMKEQHEEIQQAIEDGDAKALAEALGSDSQEVPTGMFDGDDDGPRGFQ